MSLRMGTDERAKALITHYLTKSMENAKRWRAFSESNGLDESIQSAKRKIDHLQSWKERFNSGAQAAKIDTWPSSANQRFREVGIEELYHTIYSSSSDSIHGFKEDIFNSTILQYYPDAIRDEAFKGYVAEKQSFAVFLSAQSVSLLIQALYNLALKVDARASGEKLKSMIETVNAVIASHENDHKQMSPTLEC